MFMRPAKFRQCIIALALVLVTASCATSTSRSDDPADIAANFLEESGLSGLAVTVGRGDEIVWSRGFGYADLEQNVPVDPALTKFRVGSTAKSMTAVMIGQLHERGQLDLDAPVQTYLPDFPVKSGPVTTRLLAGHLAGIRHYADDEFLSAEPYESIADALSIFDNDPLVATPGSEYVYSTYGYNLISAVLERVAGENFLSYMTRNVFAPAGMESTVPDRVLPVIPNRSRYYAIAEGEIVNAPWVDNSNKWAGGGFLSTSEDLVRFGQAHLSDTLLHSETIKMLWASQKTTYGTETGYGIGWMISADKSGRGVIRHSGGSVGGITELRIYPEQDLVIAVITNTAPADVQLLAEQIAEEFLPSR